MIIYNLYRSDKKPLLQVLLAVSTVSLKKLFSLNVSKKEAALL